LIRWQQKLLCASEKQAGQQKAKKHKRYTHFTNIDRDEISRYTAKNGAAPAQVKLLLTGRGDKIIATVVKYLHIKG